MTPSPIVPETDESVETKLETVETKPFLPVSGTIGEEAETVKTAVNTVNTEETAVNTVNTEETTVNTVNTKLSMVTSEGTILIQTNEGEKQTKDFFKWLMSTWNRKPKRNMDLVEMRRDELYAYLEANPTREALDWVIGHDEVVGDDCYDAAMIRIRAHANYLESLGEKPTSDPRTMSWTVKSGETFFSKIA